MRFTAQMYVLMQELKRMVLFWGSAGSPAPFTGLFALIGFLLGNGGLGGFNPPKPCVLFNSQELGVFLCYTEDLGINLDSNGILFECIKKAASV